MVVSQQACVDSAGLCRLHGCTGYIRGLLSQKDSEGYHWL